MAGIGPGEYRVHFLDQANAYGEVVFETREGQELWAMRPNHKTGAWEKSSMLRKRTDFAMTAAIHNRTLFPKPDEHEVAL